ncbi:MAG: cell division protein FtsL [Candidatus Binatia bacterium]
MGYDSAQEAAVRGVSQKQGMRNIFVMILVGLCFVSLALLQVWLRLQVFHLGYVLSTTTKLQKQLKQENRELRLELATLTSPEHLEKMARLRLGLREPEKGQVVVVP